MSEEHTKKKSCARHIMCHT